MTDQHLDPAGSAVSPAKRGDADASTGNLLGTPSNTPEPASTALNKPGHFLSEPGIWFVFLPEGPIAVFAAVLVSLQAAYLTYSGRFGTAALLTAGIITFGFAAYRGLRNNKKWLTWIACVGLVAMVLFMGPEP